jgi:hypothetical protein
MPHFVASSVNDGSVGTLVTLELPADSPALTMPWIITFGPLGEDQEWEPVVCGPYERGHALALAESVVADEDLMAVVEPVQPYVSVDQIRGEITASRVAAAEADLVHPNGGSAEHHAEHADPHPVEPGIPPSPDEVRAGFARLAAHLSN